jgi:hypothetical protein
MEDNNIKKFDYKVGGREFNISLIYHISQIEIKIERDNLCYKSNYNLNDLRKKNNIFKSIENIEKSYLFILEEFQKNKYSLIENNNEIILSIQPHKYLKPLNFIIILNNNYYDDNFNNLYEKYLAKKEELYELKYENIKLKNPNKQKMFKINLKSLKIIPNKNNENNEIERKYIELFNNLNTNNSDEISLKFYNIFQNIKTNYDIFFQILMKTMQNNDNYISGYINLINKINELMQNGEKTKCIRIIRRHIKKGKFFKEIINQIPKLENNKEYENYFIGNSKFFSLLIVKLNYNPYNFINFLKIIKDSLENNNNDVQSIILIKSFLILSKSIISFKYTFQYFREISEFGKFKMILESLLLDFFAMKKVQKSDKKLQNEIIILLNIKNKLFDNINFEIKINYYNNTIVKNNEMDGFVFIHLKNFISFLSNGKEVKEYNWDIMNTIFNSNKINKFRIVLSFIKASIVYVKNKNSLNYSIKYISEIIDSYLKSVNNKKSLISYLDMILLDFNHFIYINKFFNDIVADTIFYLVKTGCYEYKFMNKEPMFFKHKMIVKNFFCILEKIYLRSQNKEILMLFKNFEISKNNVTLFNNIFLKYF